MKAAAVSKKLTNCVRIALWSAVALAGAFASSVVAATPIEMTLPEGFTAELVAGQPLVQHPLMACFDDRGRLYVSDAAGVNLDDKELDAQLPNGIRRLEDTDGDGRFDRSTVFADRMTFPNGGVWHGDSLYVASAPYIWRLRDRDDDGVAEERTQLVGKFGYIGNAADIHGCFMGPEGRLWWCDGRHGHEVHDAAGQLISKGEAARIFSCKLDGSDLRTHSGGGMDNPVEIDFTRTGDVLGTVNLFYQTRGDCLVHWLHGGVYPRDDQPQCLAEFRRTGELLRPVLDYGHIAVSGMTRYRGRSLGDEYANGYFVCEFNTHKVNFTRVMPEGATFVAERHDFLSTEHIDFHPTDVLEDADGSLLVIDTGGWFRYGCPTSQVAKPEIAGGIYRIRRSGAAAVQDPRGLGLDWKSLSNEALSALLSDERLAVREQAQSLLVEHGSAAIAPLSTAMHGQDDEAAILALWALHRIDTTESLAAVRSQLIASSAELRQAAARGVGESRDAAAAGSLLALLTDENPSVRRVAAEALGRCSSSDATPQLLDAIAGAMDRAEEHSAIFALMEIADVPALASGVRHPQPAASRAALLALDQIAPQAVVRDDVLALLGSSDPQTVQTAMEVIAQRPQWTEEMPAFWRRWLAQPFDQGRGEWLLGALRSFANDPRTQEVIAESLTSGDSSTEVRRLLLRAITTSELSPLPESWIAALSIGCNGSSGELRSEFLRAAATARDLRLLAALRTTVDAHPHQAMAIAGLAGLGQELSDRNWNTLISAWRSSLEEGERETFTISIARAQASEAQLMELAAALVDAQPLELATLLTAFRASDSSAVGHAVSAALTAHPGTSLVGYAELRGAFANFPADVRESAAALLAAREVVSADQQARLAQYEMRNEHGDVARGRDHFFGTKAGCAACHRVATRGGQIGPDLTQIGRIRTRRDLGESILYPSLTLARGYDTLFTVTTSAGLTHSGLLERETADAMHLRTAQRELLRVPHAEVEERVPSKTSIMPQGFDELLSDEELDDLVAFLLSLK
ncbi:MAG: PVC-type heme-binding CxxCH protein [Planctomycetia bacterium]|nr:PVC-type heme-binding CxxCH protein [Planctomycetia bacterium]